MKTISFSVTEILPSLLDKSKTQTIRPAWNPPYCHWCKHLSFDKKGDWHCDTGHGMVLEENDKIDFKTQNCPRVEDKGKPPRFKVGDKVKLFWKQRSKHKWFTKDGQGVYEHNYEINTWERAIHQGIIFKKELGIVKITEVFEIEMSKQSQDFMLIHLNKGIYQQLNDSEEIAKRDGFKDAESFFKYFDEHYDLSNLKTFYVYRWKGVDDGK